MKIAITEQMVIAALDAYWGKRLYNRWKKTDWTLKERQGMCEAIEAALATTDTGSVT